MEEIALVPRRSRLALAAVAAAGADVQGLRIDPEQPLRSLGDGAVATGVLVAPAAETEQPYRRRDAYIEDGYDIELPLVPYYRWANRGPSTMRVWIPIRLEIS